MLGSTGLSCKRQEAKMEKSQEKPFLNIERKKTNESLNAERDKTNESLTDVREKTEKKTDNLLEADRVSVDQSVAASRKKSDLRENESLDSSDKSNRYKQLQSERRVADQATQLERVRSDAAHVKERDSKDELVNEFLEREREKTDKNLSFERTRADSEFEQHSSLLSAEIAMHLKTKTSLTSRDEFLAIVSHDLKNPIGIASSCAAMLLEDDSFKEMGSEIRSWIQVIKRNNDMALRLISDLLDMEQVAEGKLQIKLGRHNIGQIIRESIESFGQLATAKKITLKFISPEVSGEILCDRDRIMQVISNLIGNAVKFTPDGGSISINASFSESELQVSVSDTGPGIPVDKKEKIFERFVQLSRNGRKGLGLGLHISKMLIEAHKGRLWVQSEIGHGSNFIFALPRLNSASQLVLQ